MKKLLFILTLLTVSTQLFSQDTLSKKAEYRHTIQLSALDLMIGNILIDYSYFISENHSIEVTLGYRFSANDTDLNFGFKDAFWFYNQISTRFGKGYYSPKGTYIIPMVLLNYSFFDHRYFEDYNNSKGDFHDSDYEISRNRKVVGVSAKVGHMHTYKRLRVDIYGGVGLRAVFQNETIHSKLNFGGNLVPDDYPIKNYSFKFKPSVHIGALIGLRIK